LQNFNSLSEDEVVDWNWDRLIYKGEDPAKDELRQREWGGFLNFRHNRELLLYAQRAYMATRFKDYNPGRKDLWEQHNRPWDYDHILPSALFSNKKTENRFMWVARAWGNTIGNLRAWPFDRIVQTKPHQQMIKSLMIYRY